MWNEPNDSLLQLNRLFGLGRCLRSLWMHVSLFNTIGESYRLTAISIGVRDYVCRAGVQTTLATQEGGICNIVLARWNEINGHMLSTVVSVQQQPMTQQLLKFGVAKVCKPGQTPLFQREGQPIAQAAKAILVEFVHDSMQSLRVLIYKETDG